MFYIETLLTVYCSKLQLRGFSKGFCCSAESNVQTKTDRLENQKHMIDRSNWGASSRKKDVVSQKSLDCNKAEIISSTRSGLRTTRYLVIGIRYCFVMILSTSTSSGDKK
jgi:hypothetical protein